MVKHTKKLAAVSVISLFLTGCFSASSVNRDVQVVPAVNAPVKVATASAKEYVLSGDFLFDFDKATLTEQGKTTLDKVAKEVNASKATGIKVIGYTDRLGSNAYNLKLSQARANSAKAYLQSQGVKVKIGAIGRGEANQVKACKGVVGQALKDCLKPNRRVVISVE